MRRQVSHGNDTQTRPLPVEQLQNGPALHVTCLIRFRSLSSRVASRRVESNPEPHNSDRRSFVPKPDRSRRNRLERLRKGFEI